VFEGGRKEYISTVEGDLQLPYLPFGPEDIRINAPRRVEAGEPFEIEFHTGDNRLPFIPLDARLINSPIDVVVPLFGRSNRTGNGFHLHSVVPPLRMPGNWSIELIPGMDITLPPISNAEWSIEVAASEMEYPIPVLGPGLTPGSLDRLEFDTSELEDMKEGEFRVRNGDHEERNISYDQEIGWYIETTGFLYGGVGNIRILHEEDGPENEGHLYLIDIPIEPEEVPDDLSLSLEPIFRGEDELYDQGSPFENIAVNGGELTLYEDVWYRASFNISRAGEKGGLPGSMDLETGPGAPRLFLDFGGRTYPMYVNSRNTFTTMLHITSDVVEENGWRMELWVQNELRDLTILTTRVNFEINHAVKFSLEPDPFDLSDLDIREGFTVDLVIMADWDYFNRKDFTGEPLVVLNGQVLLPYEKTDDFFQGEVRYNITLEELYSGGELEMRAENSLVFASWISFLFPLPPVIFTIPVPLEGMASVVWFFIMSAAIFVSVTLLLGRSFKYFRARSPRKKKPGLLDRSLHSIGPDSDVSILTRTFLGAIFFFYAVYLMFDLFEQPTPGLSILSQETPIWIRMMLLAEASVFEEVSGRVILIGLPLVFIKTLSGKNAERWWKYLLGGSGDIGRVELLLILFSGSMFGLAHLGWGPWKVVPTFVHGLMFGYLFVKVGLHASICMHFLFDYTGFLTELIDIDPYAWLFVLICSFLLGGLYMGEFVNVMFSSLSRRFFFKKLRGWHLLVLHSLVSILLGALLINSGGSLVFSALFLSAPVMDIVGYLVWKRVHPKAGRAAILIWSYSSFAASPFGLAWVFDPFIRGDDQTL
ncbi:MAG: CPBP family intramembrane glutamic endopeptidase, partial [Thermoplasmatota archaeon]